MKEMKDELDYDIKDLQEDDESCFEEEEEEENIVIA
jgi:hypothetical protein